MRATWCYPTSSPRGWRSTLRIPKTWRGWWSPGWTEWPLAPLLFSSRTGHLPTTVRPHRIGTRKTFRSSGWRRSGQLAALTVTPSTIMCGVFVNGTLTNPPTTLLPPWWLRSLRWWSISPGTLWRRRAEDSARESRLSWRLAAIFKNKLIIITHWTLPVL